MTEFDTELQMVFESVALEMQRAREKGWTQQHDDNHGSGHLVKEAVDRLTHMGEFPTDEFVDHELTVAIGLLVNAKLTLARALTVGTFSVDEPAKPVGREDWLEALLEGRVDGAEEITMKADDGQLVTLPASAFYLYPRNLTHLPTARRSFQLEYRLDASAQATALGAGLRMQVGSSTTDYFADPAVPVGKVTVFAPPTYKAMPVFSMLLYSADAHWAPRHG
jgi:hypothetical protein